MTQPTAILAPNSRAILALIGISDGTNSVADQESEDWLVTHGLIKAEEDGVISATPRGAAWLGMLLATPLPVQVSQWSDPRGGEAVKQGDSDLVRMLREVLVTAAQRAPTPAAKPYSVQVRRTGDPLQTEGITERLPGFADNTFTALPPGQTPPTMQRDDKVIVQRRSGRVDGERGNLYAPSVIWKVDPDNVTGDDVLFYRVLGRTDGVSAE